MSNPNFSINICLDGLAVEDLPAMLDAVSARIRSNSFAQCGIITDKAGTPSGAYAFDWDGM